MAVSVPFFELRFFGFRIVGVCVGVDVSCVAFLLLLDDGRLDEDLVGAILFSVNLEEDLNPAVSIDASFVMHVTYPLFDIAVSAPDFRRVDRLRAGFGAGSVGATVVF